ncbi:DUF1302 family protein [Aquimarina aggregata]|uniref:DUF1302 family protein n=1 Tax=Aquimarina aggregata TaxID=1642818 RepID=UPI00082FE307|nr:DUF1302 family protein [Aquimarina aggregata]
MSCRQLYRNNTKDTRRNSFCKIKFASLLLIITAIQSTFSQKEKKYNIGGFVELDHISYFKNTEEYDTKVNSRNQGILQLELDGSVNDKYHFFTGIEVRNDISDADRERVFIDEAYIDIYMKTMDVRIGKQIINWGEADGINPTNNINPIDFSDIIDTDDERIGVYSISSKYYIDDITIQGVFIPVFQSSKIPSTNSRWFVDFPTTVALPTGEIIPAQFVLQETQEPQKDIESAQFALKVSTTIKGWDFSVSYFNGYDDLPSFNRQLSQDQNGLTNVLITPEIERLQVFGADFSTALGSFGLRGEAAYFRTEDQDGTNPFIDDSFYQYVIGLDRTFTDIIGENNLFVIAQWVHQIIESGEDAPNTNLNNIFQESFVARAEYEINNDAKFIVQGIHDIKVDNTYVQSELRYNLSSGVNLSVIGDFFGGKDNTFFGNYQDNNRIQARLKYSF